MRHPDELRTADDVDALASALYGGASLTARRGVVHVTALFAETTGALHTLRIGPKSPQCPYDFFALQLARARADAIVVTGQILRDEPALHYALVGPGAEALTAWRASLGLDAPPRVLVLTSGRELDLAHPALDGTWATPVIFTSTEAATRLRGRASCAVVGHPEPSASAALAWLREEGARTIVLEAGPSTTRPLHDAGLVDELALSVFRGPVAPDARGARLFADEADVWRRFGTGSPPVVVDTSDGTWTFQLFPARR